MVPKSKKRSKGSKYSRSVVIKTQNYKHKELFLELAIPLVGSTGLKIATRDNRVELELSGNYDQIDPIIDKLRNLDSMIYEALNPDLDGWVYYDNKLLTRIFSPPLGLKLFSNALKIYDFKSEVEGSSIKTTAKLDDLNEIYGHVKKLRSIIPSDINRALTRFLIVLALEAEISDPMIILQQGLDLGIIEIGSEGYYLTADENASYEKLLQHVSTKPVIRNNENGSEEIEFEKIFFRGGKIVFLQNGEEIDEPELDHSFYDQANNNDTENVGE